MYFCLIAAAACPPLCVLQAVARQHREQGLVYSVQVRERVDAAAAAAAAAAVWEAPAVAVMRTQVLALLQSR